MSVEIAENLLFAGDGATHISGEICRAYYRRLAERVASDADGLRNLCDNCDDLVRMLKDGAADVLWRPELGVAKQFLENGLTEQAAIQLLFATWPRDLELTVNVSPATVFGVGAAAVTCEGRTLLRFSANGLAIENASSTQWFARPGFDDTLDTELGMNHDMQGERQSVYFLRCDHGWLYPPPPRVCPSPSDDEAAASWADELPVSSTVLEALSVLKEYAPCYYRWLHSVTAGIVMADGQGYYDGARFFPGLLVANGGESVIKCIETLAYGVLKQYLYQTHMVCDFYSSNDIGISFNSARNAYWTARQALIASLNCINQISVLSELNNNGWSTQSHSLRMMQYRFILENECRAPLNSGLGLNEMGRRLWEAADRQLSESSEYAYGCV